MDQVFEGTPKAEIRLEGRKAIRGDVSNDWGSKLQWQISRDGKVIATVAARIESAYEHPEKTPGKYEIVLQLFKYINYKKDAKGEYTESKFIDISNKVGYTV
ncbi:MAG: hypothetical protein HON53_03445 [Planctomycetaceae bacterium]|jgi:hypothetical protein|nr:hypothetical protein [Planctomycetaceae bacterium]MBT6156409.1 hypothetical protein [Planctomycetaceae bacterium]MBT6487977.1 hypothetical protein [Planctomycetaceae bacterium]MBT6495026.1 hypothetical protein [Planctomycetaceae bacterium]